MKRCCAHTVLCIAVLFLLGETAVPCHAQRQVRQALRRLERQEAGQAAPLPAPELLPYRVEDGDTVYFDTIEPARKWAVRSRTKKEWKQYYRLIYNFPRAYPYAQAAARLSAVADSTIAARRMGRLQRQRYIDGLQDQVIKDFEGVLRKMTYAQGSLLVRLIDREVQKTSYNIIKDYKGGITAGFWQGVARMFEGDLKARYDPEGIDRETEELVQMWEEGTFDDLYRFIFLEEPPHVTVPETYR